MSIELRTALERIQQAGVPGVFAEVRHRDQVWRGAAGVADVDTRTSVTADMRHRVGSLAKTFTAAAVLQLVEEGRIGLDAPIARHLDDLVPGERGEAITVRMLINHTSGLAEYLPYAYPSLAAMPDVGRTSPDSLEDHRFTRFDPVELITMGVTAPPVGTPGGTPGVYSNTNYLLLGQLLERICETPAEELITRRIIEPAGLADTGFPTGPEIDGPHSRMYESWFGMLEPARDFSVFDMSWVGPAASLVSTVGDLNRFFALLLAGEIVSRETLAQMQVTVPVIAQDGSPLEYGLSLHRSEKAGQGICWGNSGSAWGAGTRSEISVDGTRQVSICVNLQRWNRLDDHGRPQPHPIDAALEAFIDAALVG